jgi:hypothetical protein
VLGQGGVRPKKLSAQAPGEVSLSGLLQTANSVINHLCSTLESRWEGPTHLRRLRWRLRLPFFADARPLLVGAKPDPCIAVHTNGP